VISGGDRDRELGAKPNKAFAKNQTKRIGTRMEIVGVSRAGKRKSEIESFCAMQMQGALGITTCMRSPATIHHPYTERKNGPIIPLNCIK